MSHFYISDETLKKNLSHYAFAHSDAFCYGCYKIVKPNHAGHFVCPTCSSDDLMRHLHGVGVEYGIEWVMATLIKANCKAVDVDEFYHAWLSEIYFDDVTICGIKFDQATALKDLDPIAYELGQSDMIHSYLDDETWLEVDGLYFVTSDVWGFLQ